MLFSLPGLNDIVIFSLNIPFNSVNLDNARYTCLCPLMKSVLGNVYCCKNFFLPHTPGFPQKFNNTIPWFFMINNVQSNFYGSNLSGPSVPVRLIHVFEWYLACQFSSWFMCTLCHHGHHVFYRPKVQSARDTCHWSITLCTLELKW